MATYYYDPEDYSPGAATGLTVVDGTLTPTIVDVSGTNVLRCANTVTAASKVLFNAPLGDTERADVDLYVRYRYPAGVNAVMLFGRAPTGYGGYRACVGAYVADDPFQFVSVYSAAGNTFLVGATNGSSSPANPEPVTADVVHCRLRLNGTSIKYRYWLNADAEPGTWQVDITNTVVSAAGDIGLHFIKLGTYDIEFIGTGTNGDVAPKIATPGGGVLTAGTVSVVATTSTAISVTATPATGGTGPYTYQWQRSTDDTTWANVSGATSLALTDGGLTPSTTYYYRVVTTDNVAAVANSGSLSITTASTVTGRVQTRFVDSVGVIAVGVTVYFIDMVSNSTQAVVTNDSGIAEITNAVAGRSYLVVGRSGSLTTQARIQVAVN